MPKTTSTSDEPAYRFWRDVCTGESKWYINIVACAPVLVYKAFELYILPTALVALNRCAKFLHGCCWSEACCGEYVFEDHSFDSMDALGPALKASFKMVDWVRARDLDRLPNSGPPMDQDVTPIRAAGVLAYTFSFLCTVYMGVHEVINLSTVVDGVYPPPP